MISITLAGIKFGISFWFFFILALICVLDYKGMLWCSFAAAIIHEAGHIVAMRIKGKLPGRIAIRIFNVDMADSKRATREYNEDIFILSFGGVFNLAVATLAFVAHVFTSNQIVEMFAVANMVLGVFNLLPVCVLDGGQIVEILLLKRLSLRQTEIITYIVSFVVLLPLATLGFILLLKSPYNFSLLAISLYLMGMLVFKNRVYF